MEDGTHDIEEKVVRLERHRVSRRVPGLGEVVFVAPFAGAELRLAQFYVDEGPDYRTFVNEAIAAVVEAPSLSPAQVDVLSERARAIARVAVSEAAGCSREYRRYAGSGLTGDERLYRAMRTHHEAQLEQIRQATAAVAANVVRMGDRVRKALIAPAVLDQLQRSQRQMDQLARLYTRSFRPSHLDEIVRMQQRLERVVRPTIIEQFSHQNSPLNTVMRGYARLGENLARQLNSVMRPSYFGAIEQLNRQLVDAVRPRYLESLARSMSDLQRIITPHYLDEFARFGERLRTVVLGPAFEGLRKTLLVGMQAYASWLEEHWPEVYGSPDHPPPFMFVIASLPMAIGVPLLVALEVDDEPLLSALEAAIEGGLIIDVVQRAVQQSGDLDQVAARHFAQALEGIRNQQYVDAEPALYQGLERAFKGVARKRGIIDDRNRFLVQARKQKAGSIDDLLEHVVTDVRYLKFLRAWVFGNWGNAARHGDLPESEHRRWVLRGFVALAGWLQYCSDDAAPMGALVRRLELEAGQAEESETA